MIDDLATKCQGSTQEQFPDLFNVDDSDCNFSCDHCVGVKLCIKSATEVNDYLKDDELENERLIEQIHVAEA